MGEQRVQKKFKVIFDTGSATTWLFGQKCEKCSENYRPKQLRMCEDENCSSFEDGQLENIYYGTGSVIGYRGIDYLKF